ncbi:uncharacterized protein MYCFIDRAFT_174847 [Pseudocercospora fijiensis CIRAD86]|uniref:Uncharacterized protein n=1 Tax=Pseudocercospora fijiensis (strain CIRAD86) TaxID=383855 RepID=M3B210_PSEFD|nr:uncharacterized protein MYCFIDRAFT_174847 [Pseudocercospora fijiensis CIRAD86]EME83408.1 hypothetical protein MYCFIDRAFT_174847 [Pseudocercospora fijiensis CIRAD86]
MAGIPEPGARGEVADATPDRSDAPKTVLQPQRKPRFSSLDAKPSDISRGTRPQPRPLEVIDMPASEYAQPKKKYRNTTSNSQGLAQQPGYSILGLDLAATSSESTYSTGGSRTILQIARNKKEKKISRGVIKEAEGILTSYDNFGEGGEREVMESDTVLERYNLRPMTPDSQEESYLAYHERFCRGDNVLFAMD